jgi:predicted TIM-barrel fold metal-dependent hydrolase
LIVDSQIYLWPANTPERPWVAGASPQLPEPFTIERVVPMLDEARVDRAVIVPPPLEGERIDYAQEAVKRYPGRFAIIAKIDLDKPDRATRLPTWHDQSGVLGVRLGFLGERAKWLTDGTADWFWPAAEKARLPVMFLTTGQTSLFARIAERHPQLTLIIDHMGVSSETVRMKMVSATVAESAALAKYPNVSVKLSSVPMMSSELYPFRDVTPHIRPPVRCLRPAALLLGHRRNKFLRQGQLPPARDAFHRGAELSLRRRQGPDHGPSHRRAAPVELSQIALRRQCATLICAAKQLVQLEPEAIFSNVRVGSFTSFPIPACPVRLTAQSRCAPARCAGGKPRGQ